MPRGNRPLDRKSGKPKPPRKRLSIYCEGRGTEKIYFCGLRSTLRAANVDVRVVPTKGNPHSIVRYAINDTGLARRSEIDFQRGDQVWCVFDVEAPQCHPGIEEAEKLASKYGIKLAVSNPCFELWLLLHFQEQRAYLTTANACTKLAVHLPDYNKRISFDAFAELYSGARSRAVDLGAKFGEAANLVERNPWSSVWVLVDHIKSFSNE
ncbi:RloB domain-containing protein [Nonomuraea sp. FMUSA5-5]|uniref:RloB domain-containing protein n=1 Tax=Nonomuraea composti TaxID=2720023 RepID=A0ABX1AV37_9ACTN|nr:RloB family protein [Nonomuraea sp. FMUSA5-5]NJP89490.1 RloB domain-containing protein [Nonomuraea sp. FMUSA5-5]